LLFWANKFDRLEIKRSILIGDLDDWPIEGR
jgi:hypothetical protein